jgi:hypothetical protein
LCEKLNGALGVGGGGGGGDKASSSVLFVLEPGYHATSDVPAGYLHFVSNCVSEVQLQGIDGAKLYSLEGESSCCAPGLLQPTCTSFSLATTKGCWRRWQSTV